MAATLAERAFAVESAQREAFHAKVTEGEHVEFILGSVIRLEPHTLVENQTLGNLLLLLDVFAQVHSTGVVGTSLMVSLTRNDYEPDICFFEQGKAAAFTDEQWRFPAPDFVVEVLSDSTEERDRGVKFEDYAAHGVAEYWIVDPESKVVELYLLEGETYALHLKAGDGTLRSTAIPGFEIPVRAIFDKAENLATLRRILATPT